MKRHLRIKMVCIAAVFLVALFYVLAIQNRRKQQNAACVNQLHLLYVAMLVHSDQNPGMLPRAVYPGPNGTPWHSWRARLAGSREISWPVLYQWDSAWNSAENQNQYDGTPVDFIGKDGEIILTAPLEAHPYWLKCPCMQHRGLEHISYFVVQGKQTAFPYDNAIQWNDITDGLENTILIVESTSYSHVWTEPIDLDINTMSLQINHKTKECISSYHQGGAFVCFADGAICFLTNDLPEKDLRALLTIAGNEPVTRQNLIDKGFIIRFR